MKLTHLLESSPLELLVSQYKSKFNEWPIDSPLVRVMNYSSNKVAIEQTRSEPRQQSVGKSAELQRWLRTLPGWKNVPDRDMSLFCSTINGGQYIDMMRDDEGYDLYYIIPKNGTHVGLVKDDFNMIQIGGESLRFFDSKTVRTVVDEVVKKIPGLEGPTLFDTLINMATSTEEVQSKIYRIGRKVDSYYTGVAMQAGKRLADPSKLEPAKLGISVTTPRLYKPSSIQKEAWFVGEYLKIPANQWEKFRALISE